jgi:hypothetical protein
MPSWDSSIQGPYPPADVFDTEEEISYSALKRFAGIILTEGVPQAYNEFPLAFEFARSKAAEILGIHPKQISLIGSARIGYSLNPNQLGKAFDAAMSDIDLFAISDALFALLAAEHTRFIKLWTAGDIQPRHEIQRGFWESSKTQDPINIRRGFLDSNHIPTFEDFPVARKFGEAAFKFHANLENFSGNKIGKKASIRIYQDWESAIRQVANSLQGILRRRKKT